MQDVKYSGVLSPERLASLPGMPCPERLDQGPVACVECAQEIPCNPCEDACPRGAVTVGEPITALPVLAGEKCNGCGVCVTRCPGLAVFTVHKHYSATTSLVGFPHEYLPLPQPGREVPCAGRDGVYLTDGMVQKVLQSPSFDKTALVVVEVPKQFCMHVRGICRRGAPGHVGE